MTVTVTENPLPIVQRWSNPGGPAIPGGIAVAEYVFQNEAVVISETTAEQTHISINCALDQGWAYRLVEARVMCAFPAVGDVNEYSAFVQGQMLGFSPSAPAQTQNIPFALGNLISGNVLDSTLSPGAFTDGSALSFKIMWGPAVPLPNTILSARSATTLVRLFLGMNNDSAAAGELTYYLRLLQYTIDQDTKWALNTPSLVV